MEPKTLDAVILKISSQGKFKIEPAHRRTCETRTPLLHCQRGNQNTQRYTDTWPGPHRLSNKRHAYYVNKDLASPRAQTTAPFFRQDTPTHVSRAIMPSVLKGGGHVVLIRSFTDQCGTELRKPMTQGRSRYRRRCEDKRACIGNGVEMRAAGAS